MLQGSQSLSALPPPGRAEIHIHGGTSRPNALRASRSSVLLPAIHSRRAAHRRSRRSGEGPSPVDVWGTAARDISTPAPPHVYGDNHSIFEDARMPAKLPHFRDPSRSAVFGSSPRIFEDSLLGEARRERVALDEKRPCQGEASPDRIMVGSRTAFYSGLASSTRQHTSGVISWDRTAGASVRRRRAQLPSREGPVPGTSLDQRRQREEWEMEQQQRSLQPQAQAQPQPQPQQQEQRQEQRQAQPLPLQQPPQQQAAKMPRGGGARGGEEEPDHEATRRATMKPAPKAQHRYQAAGRLGGGGGGGGGAAALGQAGAQATTSILKGRSVERAVVPVLPPPSLLFQTHPSLRRELRTPALAMIEHGARIAAGEL